MQKQSVASISQNLIDKILLVDYGSDSKKIKEKLATIQGESDAGKRRIAAAILKLAQGDETRIDYLIEKSNQDYRDILSEAEYPYYSKVAFENIPDSEAKKIYASDFQQYCNWLNKYR